MMIDQRGDWQSPMAWSDKEIRGLGVDIIIVELRHGDHESESSIVVA